MPDYRRWRVWGGTYFLTVNLLGRRSDLLVRHTDALREAVRRPRRWRSFHIALSHERHQRCRSKRSCSALSVSRSWRRGAAIALLPVE
jgi:hypothetical protein